MEKVNGMAAAERPEVIESGGVSLLDQAAAAHDAKRQEVAARYKPVMSIEETIERHRLLHRYVTEIMVEGTDYGAITGSDRKTLLKPGAEKLCAFFGYSPVYETVEKVEDWLGDDHRGEPLFYYEYKCTLLKDGNPVGQGGGSASTWESKYRYRSSGRTCPECQASSTIAKSKAEWGGGWYCHSKRGGCGAKFKAGDPRIEGQKIGRVSNPDFADVINTVQKMGMKRAYVAATLSATGASQYFTQDLEDLPQAADDFGPPPTQRQQEYRDVASTGAEPPYGAADMMQAPPRTATVQELRRDASRIDTGGAPVGTQAAADHVAQQKIAATQAKVQAAASTYRLDPSKWKEMEARFEEMARLLGPDQCRQILAEFGVAAWNQLGTTSRFQAAYDRMVQTAKGGQ